MRQERFPSFNRRDPKPQSLTPFCCLLDSLFSKARGEAARDSAELRKQLVGKLAAAEFAARLQATPHDVQFASAQQIADTACHEAISAAWRVIIDEYPAAAKITPEGFGRG